MSSPTEPPREEPTTMTIRHQVDVDRFARRVYYADQTGWGPDDFQVLWRYFNRLIQYVGPTPAQAANPQHRSSLIQAKRTGVRDDELRAMDLTRMSHATRYLLKHMLVASSRYELALARFANLRDLDNVEDLEHPLVLSNEPTLSEPYYTEHGIIL